MKPARILVITLFSGENEFEECIASVQSQVGVVVQHEIIRDLPKQSAHQLLFQTFNERRHEFDYLVKLDADMKFSGPSSLESLIKTVEADIDILSVSVWDAFTSDYMQSFNIFSSRCEFIAVENDPLFTDRVPVKFSGRRVYKIDPERRVLHGFNPSRFQAFTFGVHRGLKVMQHSSQFPRLGNAYHQLKILRKVAANYTKTRDEAARLACVGAEMVMSNEISDAAFFARNDYQDAFEKCESENPSEVILRILRMPTLSGVLRLWGWKRFLLGFARYWRRRIPAPSLKNR